MESRLPGGTNVVASNCVTIRGPFSESPGASAPRSRKRVSVGLSTAIVNGVDCSTTSAAVVLVNLRDADGLPSGACSGTVIAPRAVLTAAHCLAGNTAAVRIYLGSGPELIAQSFAAYSNYREGDPNALDDGRWQDEWLYARAYTIAGGSSEIMRTLIAERGLGLPRDRR